MNTNRITINKIQEMKVNGEPISMVTAYDYTSAKIINSTKIPIILVGDSMGNNILGYDSTIPVTVEDIIRSTKSVTASAKKPLIVADLPFFSYKIDIKSPLLNIYGGKLTTYRKLSEKVMEELSPYLPDTKIKNWTASKRL